MNVVIIHHSSFIIYHSSFIIMGTASDRQSHIPTVVNTPPADSQPIDCRSCAIGLVCAPGKTTIYGPSLARAGIERDRAMAALEPAFLTLRDPALSLEAGRHAMLRGDGIAARRGHPVLGAPLGDDGFTTASYRI